MSRLTYFIVARKLFDSPIWRESPDLTKLFLWLVGMARHKAEPKRFSGFEVKRGELVTSLLDIAESNEYRFNRQLIRWSKSKVHRMLKYLEKQEYIEILRDTYGTHIRVRNYSFYQDQTTYKKGNYETTVKQQWNDHETTVKPYNNDKNDNNDKHKDIPLEKEKALLKRQEIEKKAKIVLEFLNDLKGSKYKNTDQIVARLNSGGTVEECITIIKNKMADPYFIENPRHLNPTTLFRKSHWDTYLNDIPDLKVTKLKKPKEKLTAWRDRISNKR